jgi:hypothetical protein
MVYFDESGVILGQLSGHFNMLEIYTHLYAAFFLFIASLIAIVIIFFTLRKSMYQWPAIMAGLFYTGLIGLGEGAEHFPFLDPFIQSMGHYLHLFSAPIAIYTLYIALKDTEAMCRLGPDKAKTHSISKGFLVFAAIMVGVVIMAFISKTPWNNRIEGPFLLAIMIPTIYLVGLVIWESRHFAVCCEMLFMPMLSIIVALLTLDILIGRLADVQRIANLYIVTHSFQDILLSLSAGLALIFALNCWYSHRINRLFVLGVSSKKERPKRQRSSNSGGS